MAHRAEAVRREREAQNAVDDHVIESILLNLSDGMDFLEEVIGDLELDGIGYDVDAVADGFRFLLDEWTNLKRGY